MNLFPYCFHDNIIFRPKNNINAKGSTFNFFIFSQLLEPEGMTTCETFKISFEFILNELVRFRVYQYHYKHIYIFIHI